MRVVAVGECMVEFALRPDGLWPRGFAGDTLTMARALRALLPDGWTVDDLTRVGTDPMSGQMLAFLSGAGIGTGRIGREAERRPGLCTIRTGAGGERSSSCWRGESAARRLADDPARLAAAFEDAALVALSGITLAILPPAGRAALMAALAPPARLPGGLRPQHPPRPPARCGRDAGGADAGGIARPTSSCPPMRTRRRPSAIHRPGRRRSGIPAPRWW